MLPSGHPQGSEFMKSFVSPMFIIVIMQFQATIAVNCRVLTCCKYVNYVIGHEQVSSDVFLMYRIHSVNTGNILMQICEV
jgi:hypothetical protein